MVVVATVVLLLVIPVFRTYRFAGGNRRSLIWQTAALEKLFLVATAIGSFCRLVVSLRKCDPGAWLFFWPAILYPAVFYITFPNVRYRQAIAACTVMLGVFLSAEAAN